MTIGYWTSCQWCYLRGLEVKWPQEVKTWKFSDSAMHRLHIVRCELCVAVNLLRHRPPSICCPEANATPLPPCFAMVSHPLSWNGVLPKRPRHVAQTSCLCLPNVYHPVGLSPKCLHTVSVLYRIVSVLSSLIYRNTTKLFTLLIFLLLYVNVKGH